MKKANEPEDRHTLCRQKRTAKTLQLGHFVSTSPPTVPCCNVLWRCQVLSLEVLVGGLPDVPHEPVGVLHPEEVGEDDEDARPGGLGHQSRGGALHGQGARLELWPPCRLRRGGGVVRTIWWR